MNPLFFLVERRLLVSLFLICSLASLPAQPIDPATDSATDSSTPSVLSSPAIEDYDFDWSDFGEGDSIAEAQKAAEDREAWQRRIEETRVTEPVSLRRMDETEWREAREGLDYSEEWVAETPVSPPPNQNHLLESILRVVFYIMLAALLVIAAVLLFRRFKPGFGSTRKSVDYEESEEFLQDSPEDWTMRIAEAERDGNFRESIRLRFLQILQALSEKRLIRLQPQKTNREYVFELGSREPWASGFRSLSLLFDRIWYGDVLLDSGDAERLTRQFRLYFEELQRSKMQQD